LLEIPGKNNFNKIPRWLVEKRDGVSVEIVAWYIGYYFWERWNGKEDTLNDSMLVARANAEARLSALGIVASLQSELDDAMLDLLHSAPNWYHYATEFTDPSELIDQLLQKQIEKAPDSGMRYELQNLLKVISALESMGVSKEKIIPIPHNIGKARLASGDMIRILNSDASEEEKLVLIEETLRDIADPNMHVRRFRDVNAERMGKSKPLTPAPVEGSICLVPNGYVLTIEATPAHLQAIQHQLSGIVNFNLGDGLEVVTRLGERLLPKTSGMRKYAMDEFARSIEPNPKGELLPTPEQFQQYALGAAIQFKDMAYELRAMGGTAKIPVYRIKNGVSEDMLLEYLRVAFQVPNFVPDDHIRSRLDTAIEDLYTLPIEVARVFPNGFITVMYKDESYTIYIVSR
jgi:hypothetical protein